MYKRKLIAVYLFIISITANAQIFYNNGAIILTNKKSVTKIQGSFTNSNNGVIENNGLLIIDSTYLNQNAAINKGNGVYEVYINWVNSANFICDTSTVNLKGTLQQIKGDSVTKFYNLNLLGLGVKELYLNSIVINKLDLTVNELSTRQDTMFLENSNPNSLLGSFLFGNEAFISNLDSGSFSRKTNQSINYYYPMGNSLGFPKFRPIQITPISNGTKYNVSYFNNNPSIKGLNINQRDSVLCKVNEKFYHHIGRSGLSNANIELGYLASSDGNYNSIANWRSSNNKWNDVSLVNDNYFIGLYNSNKRMNWSNFNNINYSLATTKLKISDFSSDSIICINETTTFTVNSNNYNYNWNILGGSVIGSDSSNTITIKWQIPGTFTYTLSAVDSGKVCKSNDIINSIIVLPGPIAGFNLNNNTLNSPNVPINVYDNSQGAAFWLYETSNSNNSNNKDPLFIFDIPGEYLITQTVTDNFGCKDTLTKSIKINDNVIIPNVFTPNNDGNNDGFTFNCGGCTDYNIEINNRWGSKVYQGEKGSSFWNGRNPVGELLSNGTYFYILNIKYAEKEKQYTGFIQLFN